MSANVRHPTYRLTFEARPLAAWCGVPTALRVRWLLKRALRTFGLTCIEAVEISPDGTPVPLTEEPDAPLQDR